MKVYVATEAEVFGPERYMCVKASKKEAEKTLRQIAPHMRPTKSSNSKTSAYFTDATNTRLFFIHEEEIM